jgi:hypothetical protein
MTHLVFNSFPRSGNVFISNIAGHAFSLEMSAVHMPEIFGVDGLYNVSIFRKPEDAIASLVNKTREHSSLVTIDGAIDKQMIEAIALTASKKYQKYLDLAKKNSGDVHVVPFTKLMLDYDSVIKGISERFSIPINENYSGAISLDGSSPIWSSKYDGHIPRDKDSIRGDIEKIVSLMPEIQELNKTYDDFLV